MLLDGVMLLWFSLVGLSLLFVVIDIRSTPASPVMKWGFVLLTAYTGPFGVFLYVLGVHRSTLAASIGLDDALRRG
jgi:hypothetical protein